MPPTTRDSFVRNYRAIAFGAIVLAAAGLSFAIMVPFIPAVLWATTFAILMYPVYARWRRRLASNEFLAKRGLVEATASLYTTLLTLFFVIIPLIVIGAGLYMQFHQVGDEIDPNRPSNPQTKLTVENVIQNLDTAVRPLATSLGAKEFSVRQYYEDNREDIGNSLRAPVTRGLGQALYTIVTMVIALLTLFFMLRDAERLREPAYRLIPLPRDRTEHILGRVSETVRAVFIGTVLVAIIQGSIIGAAYWVTGVPNALILAVFSILLCIIPLLGAPILYIPIGLLFLSQGKYKEAAIILGVGFLIVSQIDNVLKPFFIGGRANLHPMAIFFAILGGVILIGPIGVMAGPMILTVMLALAEIIRERIHLEEEGVLPESV